MDVEMKESAEREMQLMRDEYETTIRTSCLLYRCDDGCSRVDPN